MKDNPTSNSEKQKKNTVGTSAKMLVKQKNPVKDFLGGRSSVRMKRLITASVSFVLALTVSAAPLFPGTYPLGIALVSALSGFTAVFSAMIGALIGSAGIPAVGGVTAAVTVALAAARIAASLYISSGNHSEKQSKASLGASLKNFAADLIRKREKGASSHALISELSNHCGTMLRENIVIRIALSSVAALFAGAWSVVEGGYSYYDLFGAVFSLLITPIVTYLFYTASERSCRHSPMRELSVYVVFALVTLSLSEIPAQNVFEVRRFNLGAAFACASAFILPQNYGIHRGALAALFCGLALEPLYAPMYALAAVVCGAVSSFSASNNLSRVFGIVSGGVVCSAWAIYTNGLDGLVDIFPPVVVACAVLSPLAAYDLIKLPQSLFGGGLAALDSMRRETVSMDAMTVSDMKGKIKNLSEGLESVSAVLSGMAGRLTKPTPAEAREIVESAFELCCASCRIREKCRRDGKSIERLESKMTDELNKNGIVSASVVPSSVAAQCWNMGRILDEINLTFSQKCARMKEGDKLSVSAVDYSLAGELMSQVRGKVCDESEIDEGLSKKLRRILSYNDFHATSATVWGKRMKHIFVGDIDLSAARLGGDDIRRLIEGIVGERLSAPEFELDGATLSMKLHTVNSYTCTSGMFSCAASSVQRYCCEIHSCGANSGETLRVDGTDESGGEAESEKRAEVDITDMPPEDVCGDVITSFEANGKQYMIISDGMGSGKEAALTSGVVVSLLERLIKSGAELETSLKMLNGIVRSCGRECSATVDIAEIDCVSGEAKFIKSGAAPSFVLRDGSIFRLQSKTVPIGIIRALDAEMIKFDVKAGDTVVMISDGAARSYDEAPWLLDLMTADETVLRGDEKCAAVTIVSEAALRGSVDDITAGVMRVRAV